MNIKHLKKSVKRLLVEKLKTLNYGDHHRLPISYVPTKTKASPFYGQLPRYRPFKSDLLVADFPKLSRILLIELFAHIGVKYVPEICLYQLDKRDPLDVFYDFVMNFGVHLEDRLEARYVVDGVLLNRVIDYLQEMDRLRIQRIFDSHPIYRLLALQKFDKVEALLEKEKML